MKSTIIDNLPVIFSSVITIITLVISAIKDIRNTNKDIRNTKIIRQSDEKIAQLKHDVDKQIAEHREKFETDRKRLDGHYTLCVSILDMRSAAINGISNAYNKYLLSRLADNTSDIKAIFQIELLSNLLNLLSTFAEKDKETHIISYTYKVVSSKDEFFKLLDDDVVFKDFFLKLFVDVKLLGPINHTSNKL